MVDEGWAPCKKLDTFENTQDIIAFLDRRGIISECDTSFLQQLLQTIGSIKLIKYTKTSNSGTVLCLCNVIDTITCISK
jgi:hypothetical protein